MTMQTTDATRYGDGGFRADTAAEDNPVGEVTLGASAALGLRSRLLRSSARDAGCALEVPFTTGSITL